MSLETSAARLVRILFISLLLFLTWCSGHPTKFFCSFQLKMAASHWQAYWHLRGKYKKKWILLPAAAWIFADLPRDMDPACFVRTYIARFKRESRRSRNSFFHRCSPAMYQVPSQSLKMQNDWSQKMSITEAPRLYRPTCLAHCSNGEHFSVSLAKRCWLCFKKKLLPCFTSIWRVHIKSLSRLSKRDRSTISVVPEA